MELKLFKPGNPELRKYIECIYLLRRHHDDPQIAYLTFPTNFTIVSVNANCRIEIENNNANVLYSQENALETYLTLNHNKSVWVRYQGAANEITIYFKPLGISAFLNNSLSYYYKTQYPAFNPYEDYRQRMLDIFSIQDDKSKIIALENYWLSKLKKFEHAFLHNVVDELLNDESWNTSISDLALKNFISRATLNTHFAKHLCRTPSEFRKIVRFRRAMRDYLLRSPEKNLTEITYEANYFDQSHMIKEFRSFTSLSPKNFFDQVSSIESGQINWLFL